MLTILKKIFSFTNYQQLMRNGAVIIDVRTGQEYDSGHIAGAKNIPIERLGTRAQELKQMRVPIICCCATGIRSAAASRLLQSKGIEAYNGGSWSRLANKL